MCLLVFIFGLGFGAKASAAVDCTATATTGVPQIECEALMALYNGTTGSGWTTKTNWNTASAVSTWFSVTVATGHVTRIDFSAAGGNNLVGTAKI